MSYERCIARVGVPGAWACVLEANHRGPHVAGNGQASFTCWDGTSYTADPQPECEYTAFPASVVHALRKELAEAQAAVLATETRLNGLKVLVTDYLSSEDEGHDLRRARFLQGLQAVTAGKTPSSSGKG